MSSPIQSLPTPTGEFQAHFGGQPGSSDAAADCKKWETLCGELLAEREMLRLELAQLQRLYDACAKSLFHLKGKLRKPEIERIIATQPIEENPTIEELIAELKNTPV